MPTLDPRDAQPGHDPAAPHRAAKPWLGPRVDYRPMMPVTDAKARIVFGVVILLVAAAAWSGVGLERIRYWMLGIALFGLAMMGSGVLQRRHDARVRRELDRAEGEWTELLRDAVAARHQGESVARLLQRRGYHEFFVRRWIADRLELELSHAGVALPPGPVPR